MKLSFRAKTILGVAAIEAVLLTLLVVSGMRFMSNTAEQQFVQRSQATVKAFSVVAKDALIASDLATLAALTREMLTYPGVVYARVRDERQEVLSQAGESQQLLRAASDSAGLSGLADGVFHSSVEIRVGPQRFGRVEIGVSAAEVQAQQALARRFGLGHRGAGDAAGGAVFLGAGLVPDAPAAAPGRRGTRHRRRVSWACRCRCWAREAMSWRRRRRPSTACPRNWPPTSANCSAARGCCARWSTPRTTASS
jgi:hypothetical protein